MNMNIQRYLGNLPFYIIAPGGKAYTTLRLEGKIGREKVGRSFWRELQRTQKEENG